MGTVVKKCFMLDERTTFTGTSAVRVSLLGRYGCRAIALGGTCECVGCIPPMGARKGVTRVRLCSRGKRGLTNGIVNGCEPREVSTVRAVGETFSNGILDSPGAIGARAST